MTSLNNFNTTLEPALVAVMVGFGMSLIFSFCQYCSERKRRREFRSAWGGNQSKDQSGQSPVVLTAAPSLWNWMAELWQIKLTRLEVEPFPSFISYFLHRIGRYSYAIASVTLVLIVRWLLDPVLEGNMPFSFFLAAVLFTARTQGIWETLLALALGFLLGDWFFAEPKSSFSFSGQHDWWAAAIYLVVGLGIVWLLKSEQTAWLRTLSNDIATLKRAREINPGQAFSEQPQRSRELLASIVDNAHVAIFSVSPEGRILTWNTSAASLLGWAAKEIVGQSLTDLLPLTRQPELQQILQQVNRGERLKRWHTFLSGKNGLRVESTITISPIKNHLGRLVGVSFIVQGRSQSLELLSQPDNFPNGQ